MILKTAKPLTCRLNRHHHWTWCKTDDGERYIRCSRCGKDRDERLGGGPFDLRNSGAYGV